MGKFYNDTPRKKGRALCKHSLGLEKFSMDQALQKLIVSMKDEDLKMRASILEDGSLYDGYPKKMEELHIINSEKLKTIVDTNGWPGRSLVGKEGADAAIIIAQNSISNPDVQKYFLVELKKAVIKGEATSIQEACLEDRILFNQGKPCLYGMLFDWDSTGNLVANVDDEKLVNERRSKLGLRPLSEALEKHCEDIKREGGGPPADIKKHKEMEQEWAERVGWR